MQKACLICSIRQRGERGTISIYAEEAGATTPSSSVPACEPCRAEKDFKLRERERDLPRAFKVSPQSTFPLGRLAISRSQAQKTGAAGIRTRPSRHYRATCDYKGLRSTRVRSPSLFPARSSLRRDDLIESGVRLSRLLRKAFPSSSVCGITRREGLPAPSLAFCR